MRTIIFFLLMLLPLPAWAIDTVYLTVTRPLDPARADKPERHDGGLTVIAGNSKTKLIARKALPENATDEEYIAYIIAGREECQVAVCEVMPEGWFPPFDRRLRNAWKQRDKHTAGNFRDYGEDVKGIEIDMPKARKIWGALIEQAAVDELRRETIDVRVAEVRGNTQDIEAMKAKRDALFGIMETVNPTLEAAQTPEELMAIWPAELDPSLKPKEYPAEKVSERRAERAAEKQRLEEEARRKEAE